MPIDFPASPTLNQTYTYNGRSWKWDGSAWMAVDASNDYPLLSSSNTFSASPQTINASASAKGLVIKNNATTPGNPLEIQNSSGTAIASVNSSGVLTATLTNSTGLPVSTGISGLGTGVATALAVNVGTAGAPVVNGGALGTPSSGTLTNATGLPISGLTSSTTTALGVGSIELGNATDTTIARVSAGVVSIEGVNIVTTSSTDTLTNKTLTTPTITQGTSTPTFTTNAYTLVAGDAGKLLLASNSTTAGTINIPTDATTNFALGTQIHIVQTGSGQLTVQATTSGTTTVNSTGATATAPKLRAQWASLTCIKTAANTWLVVGDIV